MNAPGVPNSPETLPRSPAEALDQIASMRRAILAALEPVIVGQRDVIDGVLAAVVSGGHCLLEGVPGLAKTLLVKSLAGALGLDYGRIQFTPDLMPADITGTVVLEEDRGPAAGQGAGGSRRLRFLPGPVFRHLLLADEINRAPPKTQSALLEAMQERRVSIGETTHDLPAPFLVIATQNPVEQAGTFELPEAQLDRFMLRHRLSYPQPADEAEVVRRSLALKLKKQGDGAVPMSAFDAIDGSQRMHVGDLTSAMAAVQQVHVSDVFVRDVVELVGLTRRHKDIELGCSPRAALAITHASRARAFIHGRDYVIPEDIFALADDVILHRMRLNYEALAQGKTAQGVLRELLSTMA